MSLLTAEFDQQRGRITLPRYPFPARKTRVLERSDIVEIVDWFPPAILTKSGEFLLVSRDHLAEIEAFCAAHAIPFAKRYDAWADLLEPFLDTVYSDDWQTKTHLALRKAGFTDTEVVAIRARVSGRMDWLTGVTWEWQCYGLYDVLRAMKYPIPLMRWGWRTFYSDAMEIARRGVDQAG